MKARKSNKKPQRSKAVRLQDSLVQVFTIIPTSWSLFVAFCSVFGVIEVIGPFFRYLIVSWKVMTRETWNYLFEKLSMDIKLTEADKDGLTFGFFFVIFAASALPNYIKTLASNSNDKIRRVDWRLFPIASFISAAMVSLVVSTTTKGSVLSADPTISYFAQMALFFVIMSVLYVLVAFIPTFVTYLVSYALSLTKYKNLFKIVAPIVMLGYAILWASWVPYHSQDLNLMSSFGVTAAVTLICLFVPLWMPIAQPEKLLKMLAVSILIGVIAAVSYGVDYLKYYASVPGYSLNQLQKTQAKTIAESCRTNFIAIIVLRGVAEKRAWRTDPMSVCDCLGEQIAAQEDANTALEISGSLGKFLDLDDDIQAKHLKHCVPL